MADSFNLKAIISARDQASPALKKIGDTARGARKYLLDIGNAASGFASKIGVPVGILSTIAAGFSLGAIKNAVVQFAEMGESIYHGSMRAGMSMGEYQKMGFVAKMAGVDVESLSRGMGKLALNMGKAANGGDKELAALMGRLKINMRDANGQVRKGVDLLPQLADAWQRNVNPSTRARMGMALFGKAWQEMAPILAEGSEGLADSLKRMERIKGVMPDDVIKGAVEFGRELKTAEMVTKGFQMTIAKELVPVIKPLVEQFNAWAAANRQVVASEVKKYVQELVTWVKGVDWAGVVDSVKSFGRGLADLIDMVGGAKNAFIGLVFFINLQTIMAFFGLAGAILRAGWQLSVFAVTHIPQLLGVLVPANAGLWGMAAAAGMVALKLAAIGAVGMAAYEGVKWIMEVTGWAQNLSDKISAWSGIDKKVADAMGPTGGRTPPGPGGGGGGISLVSPQRAQVGGAITVKFENAPPGMRIAQAEGQGGLMLNPSVGHSSSALGTPY